MVIKKIYLLLVLFILSTSVHGAEPGAIYGVIIENDKGTISIKDVFLDYGFVTKEVEGDPRYDINLNGGEDDEITKGSIHLETPGRTPMPQWFDNNEQIYFPDDSGLVYTYTVYLPYNADVKSIEVYDTIDNEILDKREIIDFVKFSTVESDKSKPLENYPDESNLFLRMMILSLLVFAMISLALILIAKQRKSQGI